MEDYQRKEGETASLVPKVGMQVSVWFSDPPEWYGGVIERCKRIRNKCHPKGAAWKLDILYDDGEKEVGK